MLNAVTYLFPNVLHRLELIQLPPGIVTEAVIFIVLPPRLPLTAPQALLEPTL